MLCFKKYPTLAALLIVALLLFKIIAMSQAPTGGQKTSFREITIKTEADASVSINGTRYGKTDKDGRLIIRHSPPGRLTVKIRARGFRDETHVLTAAFKGLVEIKLIPTDDKFDLAIHEGERLSTIDRQKAAETYRQAIDIRPKDADARLALARILADMREYQKAEEAVRAARRVKPVFAEASAVEGRIFKEEGDFERAIISFKRAIKEGGGVQPEAITGLGLLYLDLADIASAELDFDAEQKYNDLAIEHLTLAIKQLYGAEDATTIYQLLGRALEKQGKLKDAIAIYEQFLLIFPDSPEASAVRSFIVQLDLQLKEPR